MKANDKKELHVKTDAELRKLLQDAREALLMLRLDFSQGKLKNTRSLTLKRRELAVIQTILKEKEVGNEK